MYGVCGVGSEDGKVGAEVSVVYTTNYNTILVSLIP